MDKEKQKKTSQDQRGRGKRQTAASGDRGNDGAAVERYRTMLKEAAKQAEAAGNMDLGSGPDSDWAKIFSTGETAGKLLYGSFSNEELLDLLRARTGELGHVPAQKEVFWVYRNYLRLRFDKWPYALKKAGLSTKAGKGGMTVEKMQERSRRYDELMDIVRTRAKELGRPPHMFELAEIQGELKGWFTTWAEVLDAAGIDRTWQRKETLYKVRDLNENERQLLDRLEKMARRLNRAPLRSEVPDEMRKTLTRRFGTWRNTLYQIGLEPVSKLSPFGNTYLNRGKEQQKKHKDVLENSIYKLVDPDEETQAMLAEVREIARRLGRAPLKSELPSRTYSVLIKKCSTYRNLLHQVDLEPLSKSQAVQVQVKLREQNKGRGNPAGKTRPQDQKS
ncbi:homing endonuclease associated repeat-containing protein [Bacilliculturomica massiliensis]|uniref:homing endonuclease associated repeat-containing protein n=1 Tax=Bacilliculturomica massiliensis TaxID=1917867 RepID=UPI0010313DC0|nr:hypothetical protein [Bacilliculturomica massiliensis]